MYQCMYIYVCLFGMHQSYLMDSTCVCVCVCAYNVFLYCACYHIPFFISSGNIGWVLGAFFYGYLITQIPGGWLAERYGGKMVFGIGIVMTSVLTLFTQLAAETSVWLLVAVRAAEGFFEVWAKSHSLGKIARNKVWQLLIF